MQQFRNPLVRLAGERFEECGEGHDIGLRPRGAAVLGYGIFLLLRDILVSRRIRRAQDVEDHDARTIQFGVQGAAHVRETVVIDVASVADDDLLVCIQHCRAEWVVYRLLAVRKHADGGVLCAGGTAVRGFREDIVPHPKASLYLDL